ncbi:MAG: hypoxanthine phosphoribosyltransferase [Chitinophagales bacterium]|nr:hypoxanthine phosphoribosyltransferase [Chitinophagales bacterium]
MKIKDLHFSKFINSDKIQTAIKEIAYLINRDYKDKNPLFLVILNGAFMFASDLLKCVEIPCEVSFVKLKSYHKTESSGVIKKLIGIEHDLSNKDIIIVEDIVDSGRTINDVLPQINSLNPKSIKIATLLYKPMSIEHEVDLAFIGFEIPDAFVVGYGLDYDGLGRNLQDIYQLSEK